MTRATMATCARWSAPTMASAMSTARASVPNLQVSSSGYVYGSLSVNGSFTLKGLLSFADGSEPKTRSIKIMSAGVITHAT